MRRRIKFQKGFIQPIIFIFALVVVIGLVVIGVSHHSNSLSTENINNSTPTPTQEVISPTPTPISKSTAQIGTPAPKPTTKSDNILCNGKYWATCPSGQDFYCPSTGDAQCLVPTPTLTPTPSSQPISSVISDDVPLQVNMQSFVGIDCYNSDGTAYRGSGVIISETGLVLTNRHMAYQPGEQLKYCLIGLPKSDLKAPTLKQIRGFNILDELSRPFVYSAHPFYIPSSYALSNLEAEELDFALLKIDGTINDVEYVKGMTYAVPYPIKFPYSDISFGADYQAQDGDAIISFGYEGVAVSAGLNDELLFRLQGYTGKITNVYGGDLYFKNYVLNYQSDMQIAGGQSGSPVFLTNGKMIGLVYARGDYINGAYFSKETYIVSLESIEKYLKGNL